MSGRAYIDGPSTYYIYEPVHSAPIVFAVLFAISGIGHIWQNNLKYKSYRIGFLLPWAAALFVAGLILRAYGSWHTDDLPTFIAEQVLIFCAPPVYSGACYFIFGRALYYLPYLSPIHPGRVWTTFITLDLFTEIIAGNGASRAANAGATPAEINAGVILIKISLFLQLAMFVGFVVVNFDYQARKGGFSNYKIKVIINTLYVVSLLILLRNCFRTAALFYPWNSVANGQEWPLWVLELVPMVIVTYTFNIFPPAKYIPANHKIYLAMDGKTEIEGPGMIDKRPFLVTFFDPFDIGGIITGKDAKNRYWLKDGIGGRREVSGANEEIPKVENGVKGADV